LGAGAAQSLASGIGGIQQNIGDIRGAGTIGQGNAIGGGLGALGSINFSSLLNQNSLNNPAFNNQSFLDPNNPAFVGPPDPRRFG
jgi:hypothetical protein